MISKISSLNLNLNSPCINTKKPNADNPLERTPKADTVSFSGKCSQAKSNKSDLPQELKDAFDNKVFKFKKESGEVFEGTIREYLESSISCWSDVRLSVVKSGVIHSTMLENALEMLDSGLDYSKNYRVQAGPGTYFAGYQDMNYGNIALEGTYTGDMAEIPVFESKFYDGIMNNQEIIKLAEGFAPAREESYKLTNKYCHDLLVNEMGIDILYCAMGSNSCYVALNDDKMSLRPYNFKMVNGRHQWL